MSAVSSRSKLGVRKASAMTTVPDKTVVVSASIPHSPALKVEKTYNQGWRQVLWSDGQERLIHLCVRSIVCALFTR